MPILLEEDLQRPLPKMYRVRQQFDETCLTDIEGTVRRELAKSEICALVKPGMRVAVGVGSRGIQNLSCIVETTVKGLKELGAKPFIVSAMGSHGGGTEEGQREVLAGYGVTEERLGVPVVTTVDTVHLGDCANGRPVWFDRAAYEADLIVPINRVKLHTDFVGPIQSGLCKMLVIGLGNHKGCSAVHEEAPEVFADVIEETARLILKKAPIGFGIAILENAYDKTYAVEAVPAEGLIEREKELVQIARGNMPYIMLDEADVIVCDEIGKDISGAGFDPNILGRSSVLKKFVLHIPKYGLVRCYHKEGRRPAGPGGDVRQRDRLQLPDRRIGPLHGGRCGNGGPRGAQMLPQYRPRRSEDHPHQKHAPPWGDRGFRGAARRGGEESAHVSYSGMTVQ